MMAKTVLAWPNVAALCVVGSTRAISCLWGVSTKVTVRSYHLSSGHSLFLRKRPASCFQYPNLHKRNFRINASTESGSIGSPLMESMEKKIKEHLSADSVVVKDAYGDGRHVSIEVISSAFEGQSLVNRQRMVYKAIWEELQETVHAVDHMITRTPSEASGK